MKTAIYTPLAMLTLTIAFVASPATANAGSPTIHNKYSTTVNVHGQSSKHLSFTLKKNEPYLIIVEHTHPEFYPSVRPGFYDMKLRIKRYWKGDKKYDSGYIPGVSRVSKKIVGTHYGDREFKFFIFNPLHKHKEFRITIIPRP